MTFKVGDRVKLRTDCGVWPQPFRKLAQEGRMATVMSISDGIKGRVPKVGSVFVLFDKGRKTARDIRHAFREDDLILDEGSSEE